MRKRLLLGALVGALSLNGILLVVQPGLALPNALGSFLFGPNLVRAEIVWQGGGALHDYRLDRGRVKAVAPNALTLRERDGTVVTIAVAPTATVRGVVTSLAAIRRGMFASTLRDGDAPAQQVEVGR